MNDLEYIIDIVKLCDKYNKDGMDTLSMVENQVDKYMAREKYQGSYLTPEKGFYGRVIAVVDRYYKILENNGNKGRT